MRRRLQSSSPLSRGPSATPIRSAFSFALLPLPSPRVSHILAPRRRRFCNLKADPVVFLRICSLCVCRRPSFRQDTRTVASRHCPPLHWHDWFRDRHGNAEHCRSLRVSLCSSCLARLPLANALLLPPDRSSSWRNRTRRSSCSTHGSAIRAWFLRGPFAHTRLTRFPSALADSPARR